MEKTIGTLGQHLIALREARRLSRETVAYRADVGMGDLVVLECDITEAPSVRDLRHLARLYRVPVLDLLLRAGVVTPADLRAWLGRPKRHTRLAA